ncbi:hypothetical protein EDC04DRAFT_2744380 [Pisolithus marmoratus]|nr:hypothetical protein EDC04DRAFT_2744380 [Pisolithus marmoratus]
MSAADWSAFSVGDLLAERHRRNSESVNPESYAVPYAVESHPSAPERYSGIPAVHGNDFFDCHQTLCLYTSGDNQCLEIIGCCSVVVHFLDVHEIRNLGREVTIPCGWQDCGLTVKRKNFFRHVRELHLRHNRISGYAAESRMRVAERVRAAQNSFLEIGRKVSESGVVWQGESEEEQEDADEHSNSSRTERNELESVDLPQDEVETKQEDADRQTDSFLSESNEPLRDALPGPPFWGTEAHPLRPVKSRKAGLLSKLSTLLWRAKLPRCAQERVRAPLEIAHPARPKQVC